MTLYYLPIENIVNRYTVMMNETLRPLIDVTLYPDGFERVLIQSGEFLDVNNTIAFKAEQLKMVTQLFAQKFIHSGDVFLVGDLFFPGLEAIGYLAELQQLTIRIVGFNYAGRADETDFVQQLRRWSDNAERSWHQLASEIYVGSEFHAQRVRKYFDLPDSKVRVTGLIWNINWYNQLVSWQTPHAKQNYCIWPHRPATEKGLAEFLAAAAAVPDLHFLITSCGNGRALPNLPLNVSYEAGLTKTEYLSLVKHARWFLSTAQQETFGYALQEAILYGCEVLVPDRACYPEMVSSEALYSTFDQLVERLHHRDFEPLALAYTSRWSDNAQGIVTRLRT